VATTAKISQQVVDLRDASYHDVTLSVMERACANDSPVRKTPQRSSCPPRCGEKVSPLQPSFNSFEYSSSPSSDEESDEEHDRTEEGSKEGTESQGDEEESRGEEENEEDDDDEDADDDYPNQENVVVGASAPDDTKIDTL